MESKQQFNEERPTTAIIQEIKDGRIDPTTLTKELRTNCVEILMLEGYKTSEIAQVLKRSEKTIKRDLAEIREANSITPDIKLVKELVGEFLLKARNSHTFLSKLARSKEGSVGERAQAEYYAHVTTNDVITKLQSLGYLPSVARTVVGDIFHHYENTDAEDLKALNQELVELEALCPENKEISKLKSITASIEKEGQDEQKNTSNQ